MAIKGLGTELWYLDGSAYSQLGNVTSISGPNVTVGTSETTELSSAAAEFIGTYMDAGELTGSLNYNPQTASHQDLTSMLVAAEVESWKLVFSDASNSCFEFDGILTSFSPTGQEASGHVVADFGIKLTGTITFDGTAPA